MRMLFLSHIMAIRIHVVSLFFGLAVEIVFVERKLTNAYNMSAISAN